ncbi:hypothetical protein U9C44_10510, partial [Escherichia coli]|uniref:hypothetical protein n=1 Tax=Escherichia coli TaxID=562 RepID=UPI002AF6A6ED
VLRVKKGKQVPLVHRGQRELRGQKASRGLRERKVSQEQQGLKALLALRVKWVPQAHKDQPVRREVLPVVTSLM